jgi:hypothetical protein
VTITNPATLTGIAGSGIHFPFMNCSHDDIIALSFSLHPPHTTIVPLFPMAAMPKSFRGVVIFGPDLYVRTEKFYFLNLIRQSNLQVFEQSCTISGNLDDVFFFYF